MLIVTEVGVRRVLTAQEQQNKVAEVDSRYGTNTVNRVPLWAGPDNSFRTLSLQHPAGPLGERKYWERMR